MASVGFGLTPPKPKFGPYNPPPMRTPKQTPGLGPYQQQIPRPDSLEDATRNAPGPFDIRAHQQAQQDAFGLQMALNGGITAQPGIMGPQSSRFPIKPAGPIGQPIPLSPVGGPPSPGINQPNAAGQYGAVTADARLPGHPGLRQGIDNAQVGPVLAGGQAYVSTPNPISSVGGKFGLGQGTMAPLARRPVNPDLGGGKSGYAYNPNYERPAGSPSSGDYFTDNRQGYGPYGPAFAAALGNRPKDMTPAKKLEQKDYDRLFGAGSYKYDQVRKAFVPTEEYKSQKRNAQTVSPATLAKDAESTKAARGASLADRRANVVANAKERRALRQERIAQKKNPQVANRFFGNQQDLAMQEMRNKGAIGVAEQNARGEIARNEAAAKFQNATLGIKAFEAGMPTPGQEPTGPAAAPIPGLTTAGNGQNLPPKVNADLRTAAANGDTDGMKAVLIANGITDEATHNNVIRTLTGNQYFGVPLDKRPLIQLSPGGGKPSPDFANDPFGFSGGRQSPLPGAMAPPVGLARKPSAQDLQPAAGDNPAQARAKARLKQRGYGK